MRTKKAIYNFLVEGGFQILISLLGFVRIKVILSVLGDSILGSYQLFGQLLAYVSIAELGLTTAVAYSLYKPITEKDYSKINHLLSGTKKVFNYIMLIMLLISLVLTFNIHLLIKDNTLPIMYLQACFMLMVIANIITYFVTPRVVLFDAEQNKYVYARFTQLALFIKTILEIIAVLIFKNILAVIILSLFCSIIQNFIIYYISKKKHSYLNLNVKPDLSFWKKTKELIPHKIGMLVANNIDVVIISRSLGLVHVVTYTSYMYVINTLSTVLGKISTATLSGIGNLLVTDREKYITSFNEYNSFVFFVATVICVPLYFVITPFIELCYGSKYIVSSITCFLFVFIVFYNIIRNALNVFCNAAGLFKETLICVYIEIVLNISLSIILVRYLNITGVLLGTVISYIFSEYILKPYILNKHVLKQKNILFYYKDCFLYLIFIFIVGFIFSLINIYVNYSNLFVWFLYGVLFFAITFVLALVYYKIIKKDQFIIRIINMRRKTNAN